MSVVSLSSAISFLPGWQQQMRGEVRRGAPLSIEYDPTRLPHCRQNWRGAEVWDIMGYVRFHPRGEIVSGSVMRKLRQPPDMGMVVALEPAPLEINVPTDTTKIEIWFHNFYQTSSRCDAWDSRFGQNYWFDVGGDPVQVLREPVIYRSGASASPEMVNVLRQSITKRNVFPPEPHGPRAGTDLETTIALTAWVRNVAFFKNVWIDVHVFDDAGELLRAETLTLGYAGSVGGSADLFSCDAVIYQGTVATPGSVSPRPDARKVQYRLYCETDGQVFTDAILHQQELPRDEETR